MARNGEIETLYSAEEILALQKGDKENAPEETEAEKATRELFDELNGKEGQKVGALTLSRHVSWHDELDYLEKFPSDKFKAPENLLQYIKEIHGGGEYRIQGRIQGQRGVKVNTLIRVGKTKAELEEEKKNKQLPAIIPPAGSGDSGAVLALIMDNQRRLEERMAQMLEGRNKRPQWLERLMTPEIMGLVLPPAVTLLTAVLTRQKPSPVKEIAQLLALTKDIKALSGDAEEKDDTIMSVVKQVAGGVLQGISAAKSAKPEQSPSLSRAINNQPKKFDETDTAEFIEAAYSDNPDLQSLFSDENLKTLMAHVHNDYQVLLGAFIVLDDEVYNAVKPALIERFSLTAEIVEHVENQRAIASAGDG